MYGLLGSYRPSAYPVLSGDRFQTADFTIYTEENIREWLESFI